MRRTKPAYGFTLPELLISVGIVVLLLFVFVTPMGGPERPKAQRIKCINNLKNVSLAERLFLNDNPPSARGTNFLTAADYFRASSNELSTPNILICPNDPRVTVATDFLNLSNRNLSYFVNAKTSPDQPNAFFAGDRNLQTNGVPVPSASLLKLTRDLDLGFTKEMHDQQGNIAMNDGSVQQFDSRRLRAFVGTNSTSSNVLLIP